MNKIQEYQKNLLAKYGWNSESTAEPFISTSAPTISTSATTIRTSAPTIRTSDPVVSTSAPVVSSAALSSRVVPTVGTAAPINDEVTTLRENAGDDR